MQTVAMELAVKLHEVVITAVDLMLRQIGHIFSSSAVFSSSCLCCCRLDRRRRTELEPLHISSLYVPQ